MASTYSDLKIELIGTGEQVGTWGSTTNANLGTAIEEAIVGSANVAFSSADVTLTLTNTNGTQAARHLRLNLTGTSGGARNLILGSGCQIDKPYIINNGLADTVTVKNTTGTGVAVPAGKTMWVFNNGTNVVDVTTHMTSLTLGSALPAASGGTGLSSPGATGNVLTSNGTAWFSSPGFVAGMIMLWSGSIASVPSGWALCDGTNGTPNLRDRFVIGAGSTYAVNATGGSATATLATTNLPSHTHSISASGTTGNQSNGHTHTFSGTTSGQSADHVHSGTTASAGTHAHYVFGRGGVITTARRLGENPDNFAKVAGSIAEGTTPNENFEYNILTSNTGADAGISSSAGAHDHTITTGGVSANHTHTYSGTTSDISANHNHAVTVTGTSGATGSGTAFNILNPYYALAYIMKL
jgi:microcystin-dependent protein